MAFRRKRIALLFGMVAACLMLASVPAAANTEFDYNLVPTSGTASGTLKIVLAGSGPYATFSNLKASVVSLTFVVSGHQFTLAGASFTDFQLSTIGGILRDLTYADTVGTAPTRFNLQSTATWSFTALATNTNSRGNFVFVSSETVPVPEPGTLPLMLMGLAAPGLGFALRRRRTSQAPQTA